MQETAHNSAGFAAALARWAAVVVGALQALNRSRAQRKTDRTDRIACSDGDAAAALCQRLFAVIRRSCRIINMSDKVGLSDAIRKSNHAGRNLSLRFNERTGQFRRRIFARLSGLIGGLFLCRREERVASKRRERA